MNKYSNKLKNPFAYLILRPFSQFLGQKRFSLKIWLCHAQLHMGFKRHAKIYKKLMIQFRGKVPTDRTTDGRTDGRTDGQMEGQTEGRTYHISKDPFSYHKWSKKLICGGNDVQNKIKSACECDKTM